VCLCQPLLDTSHAQEADEKDHRRDKHEGLPNREREAGAFTGDLELPAGHQHQQRQTGRRNQRQHECLQGVGKPVDPGLSHRGTQCRDRGDDALTPPQQGTEHQYQQRKNRAMCHLVEQREPHLAPSFRRQNAPHLFRRCTQARQIRRRTAAYPQQVHGHELVEAFHLVEQALLRRLQFAEFAQIDVIGGDGLLQQCLALPCQGPELMVQQGEQVRGIGCRQIAQLALLLSVTQTAHANPGCLVFALVRLAAKGIQIRQQKTLLQQHLPQLPAQTTNADGLPGALEVVLYAPCPLASLLGALAQVPQHGHGAGDLL